MKINAPAAPVIGPNTASIARKADDGDASQRFKAPALRRGELVPVSPVRDEGGTGPHLQPVVPDLDVRNLSPREIAELSLDLYANGILSWEEHAMLAFQPELNPAFNDTVGALTGETAEPDRSRDYLDIWEKRLDFERRHNPENTDSLRNTRQIVQVLRRLATPFNVIA